MDRRGLPASCLSNISPNVRCCRPVDETTRRSECPDASSSSNPGVPCVPLLSMKNRYIQRFIHNKFSANFVPASIFHPLYNAWNSTFNINHICTALIWNQCTHEMLHLWPRQPRLPMQSSFCFKERWLKVSLFRIVLWIHFQRERSLSDVFLEIQFKVTERRKEGRKEAENPSLTW